MKRAAAFIDGYNLYHGMVEAGHRCWLWVDLWELCHKVTPKTDVYLDQVSYYTAPSKTSGSRDHQDAFLSAHRELHPEMRVVTAYMQPSQKGCRRASCDETWTEWTEKRSDVNLAVDMVTGGIVKKDFEIAVLVTGDADQVATVIALKDHGCKVIVAFPPGRESDHLKEVADSHLTISSTQLRRAQMQDVVAGSNGRIIKRPGAWGRRPNDPK